MPLRLHGFADFANYQLPEIGSPHLSRHACGFKLVNDGVDTRTLATYLGHRQIAKHDQVYEDEWPPLRRLLAGLR